MGETFAQAYYQKPYPRSSTLRSYNSKIFITTHLIKIKMKLAYNVYQKNVPMFVMPGLHYNIILEMPWLEKYQLNKK